MYATSSGDVTYILKHCLKMTTTCRVYEKQMNVRLVTVTLLYWPNNYRRD